MLIFLCMSHSNRSTVITSAQILLQCRSHLLWKKALCTVRLKHQHDFRSLRCYQGNNKARASSTTLSDFCCCGSEGQSLFSFALHLPACKLIEVTAAILKLCWCNRAKFGPPPTSVQQGTKAKMDWLTLQVHFHVNVLTLASVNIGSVICNVLHV